MTTVTAALTAVSVASRNVHADCGGCDLREGVGSGVSDLMEWLAGRDRDAALIIRTDYSDEQAWAAVRAELMRSWGDGDFEPYVHIADDPKWAGCTSAQILAAVSADEELSAVFLADRDSMGDGPITLLAVAVLAREECDSDEEFDADGGEFRTVPAGIHEMHANLMIANMSFGDFKEAAENDSQGAFQGFAI
ncbi:DUF6924 domain-containing protein [Streptomyces sp. NPDC057950]|uniref:DUF6924 domain-containing protein n=1 Tax=Streptomyces sp. NPDC057950 TaxID=3346288 RepID=UPI0036EC7619